MTTESQPTRIEQYIRDPLPWAHGHQIKSIATFVAAILEKQTGNQADLARTQDNQEAAVKRLSCLIHNQRLNPKDFPEWLCRKAFERLPRTGKVRIAIDCEANMNSERRILMVDDKETLCNMSRYLIVIADLDLSGTHDLDGFKVIKTAREEFPETRVVILNAYGSAEVKSEARRLGVSAFLHKPMPLSEVARIVFEFTEDKPKN